MKTPSVMIGMSGGVDSSAAALLLTTTSMGCIGATMELWGSQDCTDARSVAEQLGIPFCTLDCRTEFKQLVVDHFVRSYEQGLTPNPCIVCNNYLKFGLMLEKARALGCTYVATGHYARIQKDPATGRYLLLRSRDAAKDQTYFLHGLTQDQLAHTLFPLGNLHKEEIRALAESRGLITARKRDSQDICFIPDGDYVSFLRRYTGRDYPSGDFLDLQGNRLGCHAGAVCYTIGQRRGLGIALGAPAYVCEKDMARNTVTLGPNEALMHRTLFTGPVNWILLPDGDGPIRCTGKIRHSQFDQPVTLYPQADGSCRAVFDSPQRAICPGQAAVFYQGESVIGGGTILKAED